MGDEPPGYVLFQVQLPHFHCRMDSCSSLEESRVSLTWSLAFIIFLPLPLPPPSHHCFSSLLSFRANHHVRWGEHPSSTHREHDQESDTFPQQCDGGRWQEEVPNMPHDTQGTSTSPSYKHHSGMWYLYLSPKYYYAFPLASCLNSSPPGIMP